MNEQIILAARKEAQELFDTRTLSGVVWNLTDEHFCQVVTWLWQRLGLVDVETLCRTELNLPPGKAPSKSALSRFWQQRSGFRRLLARQNRIASRDGAAEIAEELRKAGSNYSAANIELIQQAAFEMLSDGAAPESLKPFIQAVVKLNNIELTKEKLALDARKVELLEKREAALKDTLNNHALTPEERERKIRETFGMA